MMDAMSSHVRPVASGSARTGGATFAVRDLSAEGARLIGHGKLVEGSRVRLELTLEGVTNVVDAEVLRVDRQRSEAAVLFKNLTPVLRRWIEDSIGALIQRVRAAGPPAVLVLGLPPQRAAALERDLARLERSMRACSSVDEAAAALAEPDRVCAAIVCSEAGNVRILALLRVLRERYPAVKRALLFGEQLESVDKEVSRGVDAVLRTPWRIRALARAIGIDSADSTAAMLPQSDD
jgi:hypothetical protein